MLHQLMDSYTNPKKYQQQVNKFKNEIDELMAAYKRSQGIPLGRSIWS